MLDFENIITSRQNPTVKGICALTEKKRRYQEGLFRFDGVKLFREALKAKLCINRVVISEFAREEVIEALKAAITGGVLDESRVLIVSRSVFDKISEEHSPEGILTVAELPSDRHNRLSFEASASYSLPCEEQIIIAQSVRDAGNLGTLIRTSAALGIDRLIITQDCADLYNPKTIRAAMGGLFVLKIDVLPVEGLADAIKSLRAEGRHIYATALHRDAQTIGEMKLSRGDAFVIGNEGHGLDDNVIHACDGCALIPMRGESESLNAAVAAAICIWETVRI